VLAEILLGVRIRLAATSKSQPVRQGLSLGPHDGAPVIID